MEEIIRSKECEFCHIVYFSAHTPGAYLDKHTGFVLLLHNNIASSPHSVAHEDLFLLLLAAFLETSLPVSCSKLKEVSDMRKPRRRMESLVLSGSDSPSSVVMRWQDFVNTLRR